MSQVVNIAQCWLAGVASGLLVSESGQARRARPHLERKATHRSTISKADWAVLRHSPSTRLSPRISTEVSVTAHRPDRSGPSPHRYKTPSMRPQMSVQPRTTPTRGVHSESGSGASCKRSRRPRRSRRSVRTGCSSRCAAGTSFRKSVVTCALRAAPARAAVFAAMRGPSIRCNCGVTKGLCT